MKPLYRVGRFILSFFQLIARWKVIGQENIPPEESMLIISNHSSYGDPVIMGIVFPYQICFVTKENFAHNFFIGRLFKAFGVVFINRDESDLTAMRTIIGVLKENKAVAIFPEGRRNKDQKIQEFKQGAAFIAYRTGTNIVPVAISNSCDFFRFWRHNIVINIGEPFKIPAGNKASTEALAECSKQCRQKIEALQEENNRILIKKSDKNFTS